MAADTYNVELAKNLSIELKELLLWHEKQDFEPGYEAVMNLQIPNEI